MSDHDQEQPQPAAEILNEPLLTESGELNEACLEELTAAIQSMPPTHERLQNDPEWSVKRWTHPDEIAGALAKYAIMQSPYPCPDGLETVIRHLRAGLRNDHGFSDFAELSLCDVSRQVHAILDDFPPFQAWNESKQPTADIVFVSATSPARDPDHDFIDLDALIHNVCLDIRRQRRADDDFDRKLAEVPAQEPGE